MTAESGASTLLCPHDGRPVRRLRSAGAGAAVLGCGAHEYPEILGIPVLLERPAARLALEALKSGEADRALAAMLAPDRMGLLDRVALHADRLLRGDRLARARASLRVGAFSFALRKRPFRSYRDALERLLLGRPSPEPEAFHYFFCRPSDPTFAVAEAVASAVPRPGPVLDLCCGSGHVTRRLLAPGREVIGLDESFALLHLASRFLAPGARYVCARADRPLPFGDRAFRSVFCSDALHDTGDPRGLARETLRVLDEGGTAFFVHLHNPAFPHPYPGRSPMRTEEYASAFDGGDPRLLDEAPILESWIARRALDLGAAAPPEALSGSPTIALLAGSRASDRAHSSAMPGRGRLCLAPLYDAAREGRGLRLDRRIPSETWAREYEALARYLPETADLEAADLEALREERIEGRVLDLFRTKVLLDLPDAYGAARPW